MTPAQNFNEDQRKRWNGADGEHWARHYDRMEHMLTPILKPLLEFAAPIPGSTVIDVGCGCGGTTIELARAVGPAGRVVGIDISEAMLEVAKERLQPFANTTFLKGDAAEIPLEDMAAELIFSRFGVMFFGDPVAAFANLRRGLRPGGRVSFACWRPIQENPWANIPLLAAYEHVPRVPDPNPEEPGPYSFADRARVERILVQAGFAAPTFIPVDIELDVAAGGSFEDAVAQSADRRQVKRALADQPDEIRAAAIESIRRALTPYSSPSGVWLRGAIWLVATHRPD